MCGRFTLRTPARVLIEAFRLGTVPEFPPRYNIAPTQLVPVVRSSAEAARREFAQLRWGLVPSWAKDAAGGSRMINARCETVATKPAFRLAFARRRCLVIGDGYYEWKKERPRKQPYYVRMADERPFAMAGLWEQWFGNKDTAEAPLETCTIITTPANKLTSSVHDRMPALLAPEDYDTWLDVHLQDRARLESLLRPLESDQLVMDPVTTYVNSPRNDNAQCIELQR